MKIRTIGVVGPCGAGKSSIVRAFDGLPHVFVIEEPTPVTDSCFDTYGQLDIAGIQREFILAPTKHRIPADTQIIVRDRIETEHIEVFVAMHKALGGLSSSQAHQLVSLAQEVAQRVAAPSAFIVVTAPRDVLLTRISRSRPSWLVESFDIQLRLYDELFRRLSGPGLFVDTSKISEELVPQVAEWALHTLSDVCEQRALPFNHELGLQWTML